MIFRLRYLPPVLGVIGAIAGLASVSSVLPERTPAVPAIAEPGGISQQQIDNLRQYATGSMCNLQGCTLTMEQSVKAIHTLIGAPIRWDELRDFYPIDGASDGGMEPPKVVFYYRSVEDPRGSVAYSVWIPAHQHFFN